MNTSFAKISSEKQECLVILAFSVRTTFRRQFLPESMKTTRGIPRKSYVVVFTAGGHVQ